MNTFDRVRRLALALPDVNERLSHGALCFFVRDKRARCSYHDDHRGDGRISLWCPAPPGVQELLVSAEPERFFKPPMSATGTFSDGWGCSSTHQLRTRSSGTRSPPSSKTPSGPWLRRSS